MSQCKDFFICFRDFEITDATPGSIHNVRKKFLKGADEPLGFTMLFVGNGMTR